MTFSVEFEGLEKALKQLGAYTERVEKAIESALFIEGEQTMAESRPLVPVKDGILKASGFVSLPKTEGDDIFVDIGYGGPAGSGNQNGETNTKDVGYAVFVHEILTNFHRVGQAKYLEAAINKRKPDYSDRLARRIRARVK